MTKMVAMPSPRGTNHAGLFVPESWVPRRGNPVAAYDERGGLRRADDRRRRAEDRRRDAEDARRRRAADEEEALTAGEVEEALRLAAMELSPEEQDRLLDAMREAVDGGDLGQWCAMDRRRSRRRAQDEPEYFRGVPRSRVDEMSGPDPERVAVEAEDRRRRREALDRHRGRHAMDSSPRGKSFAEVFPNAAAVRHLVD